MWGRRCLGSCPEYRKAEALSSISLSGQLLLGFRGLQALEGSMANTELPRAEPPVPYARSTETVPEALAAAASAPRHRGRM